MNVKNVLHRKNMKYLKYIIVAVVFMIWVGFLDVHNLKEQVNYQMKISELEGEREYYLKKIKEDSTRLSELNTDEDNLEKYAREKYYMKKQGEEIYLVKDKADE